MSPTKAQQTMSYAPPLLRISSMSHLYSCARSILHYSKLHVSRVLFSKLIRPVLILPRVQFFFLLSASPHDAHLLATFAQDSSIIRILDVRQPGQALLELRGHAAPVNSIEWSPSRRGMLASGADDSLVLLWDLLSSQSSSGGSGSNPPTPGVNGIHHHHPHQGQSTSAALAGGSVGAGGSGGGATAAAAAAGVGGAGDIGRRPIAAWQCEYEVNNISWAPPSLAASYGGDWVGVCGGRGVWGVKL
jgi:WD repeat-containing protein 68